MVSFTWRGRRNCAVLRTNKSIKRCATVEVGSVVAIAIEYLCTSTRFLWSSPKLRNLGHSGVLISSADFECWFRVPTSGLLWCDNFILWSSNRLWVHNCISALTWPSQVKLSRYIHSVTCAGCAQHCRVRETTFSEFAWTRMFTPWEYPRNGKPCYSKWLFSSWSN